MDPLISCPWKDIAELDGASVERCDRRARLAHFIADRSRQVPQHVKDLFELAARIVLLTESGQVEQFPEDVGV